MIRYQLRLSEPITEMALAIKHSSQGVHEKDGVVAVRLYGDDGLELEELEYLLPFSTKIDRFYAYVPKTPFGEIMKFRNIKSKAQFSSVEIEYMPIFTGRPIQEEHFGTAFYSYLASGSATSNRLLVTGFSAPESTEVAA